MTTPLGTRAEIDHVYLGTPLTQESATNSSSLSLAQQRAQRIKALQLEISQQQEAVKSIQASDSTSLQPLINKIKLLQEELELLTPPLPNY